MAAHIEGRIARLVEDIDLAIAVSVALEGENAQTG
jgi:hypothetical protein